MGGTTIAHGARRAEIKKAEGVKQAKILEPEGEAQAIQLVNQAADKYFVGNAQLLRKLIAVETSLSTNSKIVIPANTQLINIVGDMAGILPANGVPSVLQMPPSTPPPEQEIRQFGHSDLQNRENGSAEGAA